MEDFIIVALAAIIWAVLWAVFLRKAGFRGRVYWGLLVGMFIPVINAVALILIAALPWPNNKELKAARLELTEHRKTAASASDLDSELRRLQNRD